MKKELLLGAVLSTVLVAMPSYAVKLRDADIDFGIQYRVMYNNSNIGSEKQYDFFRRMGRLLPGGKRSERSLRNKRLQQAPGESHKIRLPLLTDRSG